MQSLYTGRAAGRARHLMVGVSALAIVLAVGVAQPGEALAQMGGGPPGGPLPGGGGGGAPGGGGGPLELDELGSAAAIDIGDGAIVVNDDVGVQGDFGAIDTNGGDNNPASVSLANDGTITVTDSAGDDAETATIQGSFVINTGVTGTIIFMQADDDIAATPGNAAGLAVDGDLDGGDGLTGGNLTVRARDGVDQNESGFRVAGSTNLSDVIVQAGNAGTSDGGNLTATFGDDIAADTFTAGALSIQGGTSIGERSGGDATATVNASTATINGLTQVQATGGQDGQAGVQGGAGGAATLELNIGETATLQALEVAGSDGGNSLNDDAVGVGGAGGMASLTVNGGSISATTLSLVGGDGGNGGGDTRDPGLGGEGGRGGDATATIAIGTVLTLNGDGDVNPGLSLRAGAFGTDGGGTNGASGGAGGKATLNLAGALIVQDDVAINVGRVAITEGGSLETTGNVNGVEGIIALDAGGSLAFTNDAAGQTVIDTIIDGGGTLRFSGNEQTVTFDTAIGESERLGALEFSDGADATFQGMVDAINMTIGENSEATFQTESSISGSVTGDGFIRFDAQANDVLTFGGTMDPETEAQTISTDVLIGTAGQGIIQINNTGGLTFDGVLGGKSRAEGVQIAENSVVVFNNTVTTDDFTVQGAGTDLTFNADSQSQVVIGDSATNTGGLTLNNGTITLGSAVGDGDTVFNVDAGDDTNVPVNNADPNGITLNLDTGFTEGSIALIDTNGLDFTVGGAADALIATFDVADTALTQYSVQARDGAADILEIAANANSVEEVAANIGSNTEEASALTNFVTAVTAPVTAPCSHPSASWDLSCIIYNLKKALGPTLQDEEAMRQYAQTVDIQNSTLGGNTNAAQSDFNASTVVTSSRGRGAAGEQTGLSAGDGYAGGQAVDVPPVQLWIEGYGGIAGADGDANGAGYDSHFGGLILGLESDVTEDLTVGVFGTYSTSRVDGDGPANASIDAATYGVGLYANYRWDNFYLSGTARYAIANNDLTRTGIFGAVTQTVTADYEARQLGVSLSGGFDVEVAPSLLVAPHAGLTWTLYDADSYTEVGLAFSQNVDPDSVSELTGTIGARISRAYANFDGAGTTFTPELSVAVRGELMGGDAVSTVAFTGGGSSYQVTGTDTADIGALIGLGATFENDNWSATLSYGSELRSDFQSHTGSARLRWSF